MSEFELTASELESYQVDKTEWDEGPWMSEPDRVQWQHAGYACLVLRHPRAGYWCGYVGVDPPNPCYGKNPREEDLGVEAHGGPLNYSGFCSGFICHVPEAGMPEKVWWLGFDCGHLLDVCPGQDARDQRLDRMSGRTDPLPRLPFQHYRALSYVRRETEKLAEKLRALVPKNRVAGVVERARTQRKRRVDVSAPTYAGRSTADSSRA